ncbi:MAG: response regulator [Terracidiphilus sp.]
MLGMGSDRNLPTILLVDEDLVSREVVATLLTMNGYTLHTASDAAASVEMLKTGKCHPQVILVDLPAQNQPAQSRKGRVDVVDMLRALRAQSKAALYAMGADEPSEELRAAVNGYLKKPVSPEALQKVLSAHNTQPSPLAGRIAAEPVINPETLAQFRQLMQEATVREVYDAVAADLRKRIPLLEEAIGRGDRQEIRQIGHSIKGGCGMAGAIQAARVGALLEEEKDEMRNSAALLGELQGALERLEQMLEVVFSGRAT